jgi:RNA polymerase sigma-70 factor (ECF subfamily)
MVDVDRLHRGDAAYVEELIRAYGALVLGVARSFARDLDHADDLFQEVWQHVYRKRQSYQGRGSFEAWLHRLATNVCRSEYRGAKVRGRAMERLRRLGDDPGLVEADSLSRLEVDQLHAELRRALGDLSEREHEALMLRVLEEKSPDEVAQIMGVEKSTVRSLIRHALRRLRDIMEVPGDDLSVGRSSS